MTPTNPGTRPLVVSFGGGVNSAAMLVGMHERGIRPDLILFSDTGGEKPETYASVAEWSQWAVEHGMPEITRVSVADNPNAIDKSLEASCLRHKKLPSIAYGWKRCSQRWKADPIRKFKNNFPLFLRAWERGEIIEHAIGFDAGEQHRTVYEESGTHYIFPLRQWGWAREQCVSAIKAVGMPVPPKSSCFFCPSKRKSEILALKRDHPDLLERALQIERNAADGGAVQGLGRNWSWGSLIAADEAQAKLFNEVIDVPCMCFDGEDEDDD